ncbi:radical SAM protein [Chloroflexota bacterium]
MVNRFAGIQASHTKLRAGPDGLYCFNRTTGLNILFDEIKLPNSTHSRSPRQVSIALTNSCDLSCSHCYAPKTPATLSFDKVTAWLTELDRNGCIGVGFGGGEPTLYPRLTELCHYAARQTNLAVIMTTHGHLLDNRLLGELNGNIHFVRVSMDGIGATYESFRGRSFDELLRRINALGSIVPFGVNYLVNSKTIWDIESAVELSDDLGASEFLIIPEVSVGRGRSIDPATYRQLRQWVRQYNGRVRLSVSENSAEGFPTCHPFELETGLSAFAHIDASGNLKRTSYERNGTAIQEDGVMAALDKLQTMRQGVMQ